MIFYKNINIGINFHEHGNYPANYITASTCTQIIVPKKRYV